jgi:ABC-type phosphate transport system substrate-binding protein
MLMCHIDAGAQDTAIVVIANNTVPETPISTTDIQNIFLGKKTKVEGTKVTFVILQSGEVHEQFLKTFLSRTPDQYIKYWKKMVFTGKGKSPKAFETEEDMVAYVESTEGAIGYVSPSTAETLQNQQIHQVTVQ